jgi:hypothetical protein
MRIFERSIAVLMLGAALVAVVPASAFDGSPVNQRDASIPLVPGQPGTSSKSVAAAAQGGDSFKALEYAADIDGYAPAQWKLGRMYAAGEGGLARNDLRAFEYFSRIAREHAQDSPLVPQSAVVANAFVALARYYLSGIPGSEVKQDPDRAREMLYYAASYFGSADAQYDLGRLYLKSPNATPNDFTYGARWLGLAAQKGQHQAQALLGQMLFNGDRLPPQRARGLMWMALASEAATPDEAWIKDGYAQAVSRASEDDRAMAAQMLKYWVQGRRE